MGSLEALNLLSSRAPEGAAEGGRDPEGGASPFPRPNDITGKPYVACVSEGTGYASVAYAPEFGRGRVSEWLDMGEGEEVRADLETGEVVSTRPKLSDLDKAFRNLDRANKRARKEFVLFCVKNRLTKMWTLTYAVAEFDKAKVKREVNEFFRGWRANLTNGESFPAAYCLERHKSGAWHVHIAVQSGFTDKRRLQEVWGHGLVQYAERRVFEGLSGRALSRRLARYLGKYLDKSFVDEDHVPGEHRYEVTEGFAVLKTRARFSTLAGAEVFLRTVKGETFVREWSYLDAPDWTGPPVWTYLSG